jgi:hypothetical protein
MTFGYNLARLNLDSRHEDAGYRYAVESDDVVEVPDASIPADPTVLRAEFTPTTPFCPQTHTLTIGSFRAWNGLRNRHEFDLVRVRAAEMHHQATAINDRLVSLEEAFLETGDVREAAARVDGVDAEADHGSAGGPATASGTDADAAPF